MKVFIRILIVLVVIFIGIQFIPANHKNPPVENTVEWATPETKEFFDHSCANCHSNETKWPWYSYVAPVSWWIAGHVHEGREHFNISDKNMGESDNASRAVSEGWMPLESYLLGHPEARLTEAQRKVFAEGLAKTFGKGE